SIASFEPKPVSGDRFSNRLGIPPKLNKNRHLEGLVQVASRGGSLGCAAIGHLTVFFHANVRPRVVQLDDPRNGMTLNIAGEDSPSARERCRRKACPRR